MEKSSTNTISDGSGSKPADVESTQPVKDRFSHGGDTTKLFEDRKLLQPSNIVNENRIVGRDDQLNEVIATLEPALNGDPPDDMLIHGPPGTGKSLIVRTVANKFVELGDDFEKSFGSVYLNCRNISSEDSAAYNLTKEVANELDVELNLASHGITTTKKYNRLFEIISNHTDHVVIILDELDNLQGTYRANTDTPAYSDLLYELSRAMDNYDVDYQLTVAILTNDGDSLEAGLDPRVNSSFNPEQIVFEDYNAPQLESILTRRKDAFREGVLEEGVIQLAAAYAAQGKGDAREAIDLLKATGKLAKKRGADMVRSEHCEDAEDRYKTDFFVKELKGATISKQITVYAAALCDIHNNTDIEGVPRQIAYKVFRNIADKIDADTKSQKQVSDYLDEYVTNSLFDKSVEHFGQSRGSHSIYQFHADPELIKSALKEATSRFANIEEDKELFERIVQNQYEELES